MKEVYQLVKNQDEREALKNVVTASFNKIESVGTPSVCMSPMPSECEF